MQKRAIGKYRVESESDKIVGKGIGGSKVRTNIVTKLGTVRQLTGRTMNGTKDDGSETSGNNKYET